MIDLRVVLRSKGVNALRDESKVRLPLLLMKTDVNVFPKNLAVSPRGTGPIEPSSLPGKTFALKPGRVTLPGGTDGTGSTVVVNPPLSPSCRLTGAMKCPTVAVPVIV